MFQKKVKALNLEGQRRCRNHLCRQMFTPSPRFPNAEYCVSCEIDRQITIAKKKEARLKKCKNCRKDFSAKTPWERFCTIACQKEFKKTSTTGAITRKKDRRARRKLRRRSVMAYPHAGFAAKRKQMALFEPTCEITGISNSEHEKKFKSGLHLDHIIPARIASEYSDPHVDVNLMWLAHSNHAQKKSAEEQLKGKGGMYGYVLELKRMDFPMHRVKAALQHFGLYSQNLPF